MGEGERKEKKNRQIWNSNSLLFLLKPMASPTMTYTDLLTYWPSHAADSAKVCNIPDERRVSQDLSKYKNETACLGEHVPSLFHKQQCADTIQSEAREGRFLKSQENHRDPTVCSSLLIFKKLTFTYAKGQKKWKIYWKGNFISHEANMLKKPLHSISSLVWNAESRAELFHIVSASETGAWKQHVRDLFVAPCLSTGEFWDIDSNLTSWKQEGGS